jgi:hypothetical protein
VNALPRLLVRKARQRELGVTKAAAEAIMRRMPVGLIEDLRKTNVKREDLHRYLEARKARTFGKDRVAA